MPDDETTFYRRRLPHWQPENAAFFLTWRLYGSLPAEVLERLEAERQRLQRASKRPGESERERKIRHNKLLFAIADEALDRAIKGPLWLKDPRLAELVVNALFFHAGRRYTLWSYVVMANHVHVLLWPKQEESTGKSVRLRRITQSIKGYTARDANRLLRRTGQPFWEEESYDHWPRDREEFYRIIAYIENNPVKAGLVRKPEEWRWSSAWERAQRGWTEIQPL